MSQLYDLHGTIENKLREQLEMADREMGAMRHAVEFSMAARDSLGDRLEERKTQIQEQEQESGKHARQSFDMIGACVIGR
jgi:hypothetical protein